VEESNSHVSRAHCDTPGIGDQDITPTKLLALLEQELKMDNPLDGIIVTTPTGDNCIKLGAQVVQTLVDGNL